MARKHTGLHQAMEASGPCARKQHRYRVYRDLTGYFLRVRDALDQPFEAPQFPRGILLFETIREDLNELGEDLIHWMHRKGIVAQVDNWDIVSAPAESHRCRLYKIGEGCPSEIESFAEVWDTIEEPLEYRDDLPKGDLIANEQDFSRVMVRNRMQLYLKSRGIVSAGSWTSGCVC